MSTHRRFRVLMLHRPNALTHPGGDTVVAERLVKHLSQIQDEGCSWEGVIDTEGSLRIEDFDLVQLFNFSGRETVEKLARRAVEAARPYVVTTMYEDWPKFHNHMAGTFAALRQYVVDGQPTHLWPVYWRAVQNFERAPKWDNSWTANNAGAVVATGEWEAAALRRDYPEAHVYSYFCGCDAEAPPDKGEAFRRYAGVEDYILCVGRLEWRKNQLMLLKAFEESEHTLVFATGGVVSQADYTELCKKFKRKGKTLFLDRLPDGLLESAYAGCAVHVLPSWCELPGLVSIEAARAGRNIVVSDYGTIRDYVGAQAFYCDPGSAESIYRATMEGIYSEVPAELARSVAQFTWQRAAERHRDIYKEVLERDSARKQSAAPLSPSPAQQISAHIARRSNPLAPSRVRLLMQIRSHAFTHRGGDTVVLENIANQLSTRGYDITVDAGRSSDPAQFDVTSLFNFTMVDDTRASAERVVRAGKPFVINALHEDHSRFYVPMTVYGEVLTQYVQLGQGADLWQGALTSAQRAIQEVGPISNPDSTWTAEHASVIIATGPLEAATIRRDYPRCGPIVSYRIGCEVAVGNDGGRAFREMYDLSGYVLCVGRLESRKNQLMLLKALEDSELPVVLVAGGFTYQPAYDQAVREFKRRGKTVVLGRLSPELLQSAFSGAAAHVLPSWYELPGLVSLEAARYGAPVVVTSWGTAPDYFGNLAEYCEPSDPASILAATERALHRGAPAGLVELAQSYTWSRAASDFQGCYEYAIGGRSIEGLGFEAQL